MEFQTIIRNMNTRLIGRERELENLKSEYKSRNASFIALYGRRRVGKTFLIQYFVRILEETTKDHIFWFSGSDFKTNKTQCEDFLESMNGVFNKPVEKPKKLRWHTLFSLLTKKIQYSRKSYPDKKILLVFDEIQWLDKKNSNFLASLAYQWNTNWYFYSDIKLIVSGSSPSFIKKKILKNKGDLYGRLTLRMELKPFTINETKQYFKSKGFPYTDQEIAECYMCIGGIPYYLDRFEKEKTVHENLRDIFFGESPKLPKEMDDLFTTFSNSSDRYLEIVKMIHQKTYGIRFNQLQKKYKHVNSYLNELIDSNFIQKVKHLEDGRYRSYRIIDPFINFYLNWIQPDQSDQWKTSVTWDQIASIDQNFRKWLGYQFELFCWNHKDTIRKALKIQIGVYDGFHWKSSEAEVDLFFIREDGIVQIFEIKYTSNREYTIDKQYSKRLENKIEIFNKKAIPKIKTFLKKRKHKKIKYQRTILSLITFNDLKQNQYSKKLVDSELNLIKIMS